MVTLDSTSSRNFQGCNFVNEFVVCLDILSSNMQQDQNIEMAGHVVNGQIQPIQRLWMSDKETGCSAVGSCSSNSCVERCSVSTAVYSSVTRTIEQRLNRQWFNAAEILSSV